jgi:streptogramin lyase
VPLEAQGAAFDRQGNLWVSASNSQWGRLYRLDRQGKVAAQYEMVAGLEDLAVDEQGRMWGLSESGTRKYIDWTTRYPYVFRIDPARLK